MIFTDQSRQSDEADCKMKRYLHYHSVNGYGIDRKAVNLPTATGIHIHEPVQKIMELLASGKRKTLNLKDKVVRGHVRLAIKQSLSDYAEEIKVAGSFRDNSQEQEDTGFFLTEQSNLVEGFTWAWLKVVLPILLGEFEVVAVEHEESIVLGCTCGKGDRFGWEDHDPECDCVVQQSRPDLVMRRKGDGQLGIHDLKTHKYVGDSEIQKYKTSIQMAVGTVGVERRLREPVTHYYVHAFEKGARKKAYTPETKGFDGRRQQQSHFCHVGWRPASLPTQRQDRFDIEAKWYQRTPVWEMKGLVGKPPEYSNVEWLVEQLPLEQLQKRLFLIGPYDRQGHLIKSRLTDVEWNERRWVEAQWKIYEDAQQGVELREAIARHVGASWNCFKYGNDYPCQFYDICHMNGVAVEDPLRSGLYVLRTPHHPPELEQMKAKGVVLPEGVPVVGGDE